jgi:hypothetical protein
LVKSTFNSVQLLGEYSDLFGQKNVLIKRFGKLSSNTLIVISDLIYYSFWIQWRMFDKKDKTKFYAELLRNLGTALVAGAYITLKSGDNAIYNALIALSGILTIIAGALIMEV